MGGIVDGLIEKIENFVGRILFMLEKLVCLLVSWMQDLFAVFTGVKKAYVGNDQDYLVNVFFGNKTVNAIYWGMAAIGIVMAFAFAIMAVIKKSADLDDKMRTSHSQILRTLLKSILITVSMSVFMIITIAFTNTLMDSVNEVFDNGPNYTNSDPHKVFTKEQYAAMGRIFNSVGNYSLNPSYNNRYNLNTCYNEIRADLKYLSDSGVFDYFYVTKENGKIKNTWQSALQDLAAAADFTKEQPVDTYNEGIANALNNCMDILKNDYSFKALETYDATVQYTNDDVQLDRILFLLGTMGIGDTAAARNEAYNKNPDIFDNVRGPYYTGEKDFYDIDQVNEDFYVSFTRMNYFVIYLAGIAIIVNMAVIMVNCIVRIFNLLFLYIIAPPIIATMPLDDGGKFKQWITAFIVQAFSVFATLISMRLFLIYIPIVMNPELKLVESSVLNMIGKLVMIWAGTVAIEKANGLLTGILADSAGWQSITAGSTAQDVKGSTVGRMASQAKGAVEGAVAAPVKSLAGTAWGVAKGAAGAAANIATLPARPFVGAVSNAGKRVAGFYNNVMEGASNAFVQSPDFKAKQQQASEQASYAKDRQENRQFRNNVNSFISNQNRNNGNGGNIQPPPQRPNEGGNANNGQNAPGQGGQGGQGNNNDAAHNDAVMRNLFGVGADEAAEIQRNARNNQQPPPGRGGNNNGQ